MTCGAGTALDSQPLNLLAAMLPHEMKNPICLCKSLIGATGTLERGRILLGMLGGDVNSQRLRVEELLLTGYAGMG